MKKLLAFALVALALNVEAQIIDPTFQAVVTFKTAAKGAIYFSDGKYLLVGRFLRVNGQNYVGVAKFNADGTIDNTFNIGTGADNDVLACSLQSDGKILLGGKFTSFNGVSRVGLIRLNADGSVDNSFVTNLIMPQGGVLDFNLLVQPDGKILFNGSFTSVDGVSTGTSYLARFNSDGSRDASFTAASGFFPINDLALQSDNKIIICGGFSKGIARLNSDGSIDGSYSIGTGFNSTVYDIEVTSSDGVIAGGLFTQFNGATNNYLARLTSAGSLDATFQGNGKPNNYVQGMLIQPNGKILITGGFTSYNSISVKPLVKLNTDGTLDASLNVGSGATSALDLVAINSIGDILVGGYFLITFNGQTRNLVALLSASGSLKPITQQLNLQESTSGIAVQRQGTDKILLSHQGDELNGVSSTGFERLNLDGTIDATFNGNSKTDKNANTFTFDSNGMLLIGGRFTTYNGVTASGIARLSSSGILDNAFSTNTGTGFNGTVYVITEQPDGKLLVGGFFSSFNGTPRKILARLNSDGSLDASFNAANGFVANGTFAYVYDIEVLSDGKILVAGDFSSFSGNSIKSLIRLNSDGTLDNTFLIGTGVFSPGGSSVSSVNDIEVLSNGKILIGGSFNSVNDQPAEYLEVLNSDGTLDNSYSLSGFFAVKKIKKQSDGKFVILDNAGARRLNANVTLDPTFATVNLGFFPSNITTIGNIMVATGGIRKGIAKIVLPTSVPNAPTTLVASLISQNSISLSWTDNATDETGYALEQSIGNNTNFITIANLPINSASYVNSGLIANTQYYYRVTAYNATGNSPYSNEISPTTLPITPPAAPTNLSVQSFSSSQVVIGWIDNSNDETGFEIYRSTPDNSSYILAQTTTANTITFADNGLLPNTSYFYKIRAIKNTAASGYTNEVTQKTFPNEWSGSIPTSLPGRSAGVAIVLNGKAYVGLGRNSSGALKDWWEFDPTNNAWTAKLDFPGAARIGAVAFVVNGKGYVGTGNDFSGTGFKQDFYEYDPATNVWTRKADFPQDFNSGAGITSGVAFTVDTFGYVGLGNTGLSNTKAFYRYDPTANTWQARADFGGNGRTGAIGFAVSGKGYLGFGFGGLSPNLKDMWLYDPAANQWTKRGDYNGAGRGGSAVAIVNNDAYIFAGIENTTGSFGADVKTNLNTQFSTQNDGWSVQLPIPASVRVDAMAFTIGKKAFVYGGYNFASGDIYLSDLYSFTPTSSSLPSPPLSASATVLSETSVKCTWTDASDNETGFVMEYAVGTSSTYSVIATLPAGTTQYTHTGLSANTQYKYRVKAINEFGSSTYANANTIITTLPPASPSNLTAQTVSTSSITISWSDNSTTETGFEIYRSTANNSNYSLINTTTANVITFTDVSLSSATTYFYKVRAINAGGGSPYSNDVSQVTLPPIPSPPTNLRVQSFTASQVVINWADNSSDETGFEVYRSTLNNTNYVLIQTTAANVTTFTNTGLSGSTVYFYRVRAINTGRSSAYSNEISQTTLFNEPTNLAVQSFTTSQIVIAWTDNSSNETGFEIYRSLVNNTAYALIQITGANVTSFTNTGLTPSTNYYYKVRAVNSSGSSSFSNEVNQTTLSNPPSNLTAMLTSSSQVLLNWTDNASNETGFEIHRSVGNNSSYSLLQTTLANVTSYTDNGLSAGTNYYYKVRSLNPGGNSDFSQEVNTIITGLEEQVNGEFVVYPNPVNEELVLRNQTSELLQFVIYNSLGQQIAVEATEAKSEKIVFCGNWASGMYVVTAPSTNKTQRIVKE
jgi:uncharacterized delta-60 repeat protein